MSRSWDLINMKSQISSPNHHRFYIYIYSLMQFNFVYFEIENNELEDAF
jgi:hypothetical protein